MRILCDTSIILDVLLDRAPFVEASAEVLKRCEIGIEALSYRASDFEDCLAAVCAKLIHCDFVVTRDIKGFVGFDIPILTPSELIERMER